MKQFYIGVDNWDLVLNFGLFFKIFTRVFFVDLTIRSTYNRIYGKTCEKLLCS